jgi:predicted nucleic acid-binding protein
VVPTVLYDACVLYPAPLRDLLMLLALTDVFKARWTDEIHDEWTRSVLSDRPDVAPESLARCRQLMNEHVSDCLISGYELLIPTVTLPDPDDRHVLAAAIHGGADLIVTFNLNDFPAPTLDQFHIRAVHPDEFIARLWKAGTLRATRRQFPHNPQQARDSSSDGRDDSAQPAPYL